ncbi:MAG: alpha/beta fold hydrolase [Sulfuriferula sp.]
MRNTSFIKTLSLCLLWLVVGLARAEVVQVILPSKLMVSADYRTGSPSKPAVILLHGFLQTRLALPMSGLAETLNDAGYTVLVPTLSGGYNLRNKTLACEAAQHHSMATDTDEVQFWVGWLKQRTQQPIVLVGHSSSANVVLNYAGDHPDHRVRQAILVSIVPIKAHPDELRRTLQAPASNKLAAYTMAYCQHNYLSTRTDYLSYAIWDENKIIRALSLSKIPVNVLIGSEDKVFPVGWGMRLQHDFPATEVVPGAGHFFDGTAEFELGDRVLGLLTTQRKN